MKRLTENRREDFRAEDGGTLEVYYTNMGEPYREGIQFYLHDDSYRDASSVFLESSEALRLRDLLLRLLPITDYPPKAAKP